MGTFGVETSELHAGGMEIQKQADEFIYAHKKMDETIDFLVKAYPSSDGAAIAESIKEYNPQLQAMERKLQANGEYGVFASKTTVSANEDITSKIAKNI